MELWALLPLHCIIGLWRLNGHFVLGTGHLSLAKVLG